MRNQLQLGYLMTYVIFLLIRLLSIKIFIYLKQITQNLNTKDYSMPVVDEHRAIYSKGQTSTWLNYSTERIYIDKALPTTIKHLVLFKADFTNLRLKKSFELWAILVCQW